MIKAFFIGIVSLVFVSLLAATVTFAQTSSPTPTQTQTTTPSAPKTGFGN